jgi:5-methylcytosine-specific restriction enzyme subunit McrC
MTIDMGIFIRNIYYMLSYAFQELRNNNYENIAKEDFERIFDLFAEILFKGVSMQLKQGLCKEYIEKHESLPTLKGHIDINNTIRNKIQRKNILACDYDELSENNRLNQIIKSTILKLVRHRDVDKKRKAQLFKLLPFFCEINEINLGDIKWNMLRFQRNNQSYKMLMNICYFINSEILMTTEQGNYRMLTFSDDNMNKLYERFVLEYYKQEHKEIKVNADKIDWNITQENSMIDFLPAMQSDITLRKGEKTLIIDTKYYSRMTQQHFDKAKIHSVNMYQIFSYVKNEDVNNTGNVSGLLLYAKTNEEIVPNLSTEIGGNKFYVQTLDLKQDFEKIKKQLDSICNNYL